MSFLVRMPADQYARNAFDGLVPGPFGIGMARAAAWLAQLAYEDETDKIDSILDAWKLRRVAVFEHAVATFLPLLSTRGFVVEGYGAHFVVFEGTDPLVIANWVTNLRFLPSGEGVHRGFDAALEAAWREIASALRRASSSGPLFVIGHSLGGALAVLCAQRAKAELGIAAEGIYTLGMPRVGNAAFAAEFNQVLGQSTYRLVHGEDIVPTVPPPKLKFAHVGRILKCRRHTKFDPALLSAEMSDEPPFVARLAEDLKIGLSQLLSNASPPTPRPDPLGLASRFLPPGIADHLPDRYWHALAAG